jgi:hypothetical protein
MRFSTASSIRRIASTWTVNHCVKRANPNDPRPPRETSRVLTELPTAGRQPAGYRGSAVWRPTVDNSPWREKKLDPHDINRVKPENPASLRSDCPACSGMPVQLGVESVSSFTGIRNSVIWPKMPFHFWIRNGPDDVFTTLPDRLKSAWKPCCTRSAENAQLRCSWI